MVVGATGRRGAVVQCRVVTDVKVATVSVTVLHRHQQGASVTEPCSTGHTASFCHVPVSITDAMKCFKMNFY